MAKYAENLYWILSSHINGYRMLHLGTLQKGTVKQGMISSFVKKF
jgi:hypothetical protein